jgi:CelD/BcsL family acetyltransferase involved in cellulose biosynthesis
MARVEVVDDNASLLALREEWSDLLERSAADSPFLTWEWLSAWWRHLGRRAGLHVLTVRQNESLIGVLPLAFMPTGPLGMSRLDLLGTGTVASDYLDAIARTGCEEDVVDALTSWFRNHALALQFDHVRTPGSLAECLATRLSHGGWTIRRQSIGVCPFIRLSGHTWEALLGTFGASHRANVRRRIRAMSGGYNMTFEQVIDEPRRQTVFPDLVSLHNQRWGQRGGTAFHNQASQDFHNEAMRLMLERGWLRLFVLTLNGATAAVQYLLAYKGRVYFYQHGYDAKYSSQSVGLVSFALAIRSALEEGATEFDMLWGDESYKQLWAHDARSLIRLDMFPPDARGELHRRTSDANRAVRSLAKRLLKRAPETREG